ncbi:DUF2892 domain-containing protein [Brevibacillus sp. GCM10020057]|uniref:YgaP family membrane protein n=1 Tax=Brevibacillus sp. GCM10020057 TaxID=3317327 RepID=UPI003631C872
MQKNVGTTDALIRITGGLLGLAYGIGRMSRRPYKAPWLLMAFSAMKVAEGVTRQCLMYRALGINTYAPRAEKGMPNLLAQAKNKGFQMVMSQVARTMNARKNEETTPSPQNHAAGEKQEHRQEGSKSKERNLSPEDQLLEKTAQEFVTAQSKGKEKKSAASGSEKTGSEPYSHDEHRYPTYS